MFGRDPNKKIPGSGHKEVLMCHGAPFLLTDCGGSLRKLMTCSTSTLAILVAVFAFELGVHSSPFEIMLPENCCAWVVNSSACKFSSKPRNGAVLTSGISPLLLSTSRVIQLSSTEEEGLVPEVLSLFNPALQQDISSSSLKSAVILTNEKAQTDTGSGKAPLPLRMLVWSSSEQQRSGSTRVFLMPWPTIMALERGVLPSTWELSMNGRNGEWHRANGTRCHSQL